VKRLDAGFDRVDAFQRRHVVPAFVHAVFKRYGEDRGGWLGAVISYYGFFSLLPALLAFVTVVYLVLGSHPTLLADVLAALWATLPFVGARARQQIAPISGTVPVIVTSLLISIWGAVGVVRVLQDALNVMWCVPAYRRPGFFPKLVKGLLVLLLIAGSIAVTGTLTVITLADRLPAGGSVGAAALNVAVDFLLAAMLFRVLTARPLTLGQVWPGAAVAGVITYLLTILGGIYVERVIGRASAIYGSFAAVIGLLAWVSLLVQGFVLANLVNVVRTESLWPRTMTGRNLGDPDRRAVRLTMRREALVAHARLAAAAVPEGQEGTAAAEAE
jgi:uncharacterized BrkB/YihY/UPF0761 family membrane protein